jgi:tetratricopeptide (TPR) repeat protein
MLEPRTSPPAQVARSRSNLTQSDDNSVNRMSVNFWKERVSIIGYDASPPLASLANAFKMAGMIEEALTFWKDLIFKCSDFDRERIGKILYETFDDSVDLNRMFRFWESVLINLNGRSFGVIEFLESTSAKLGNQEALINVYKRRIRNCPDDYFVFKALTTATEDLWDPDVRVAFWKGVIRKGGYENDFIPKEMRVAFDSRGDDDDAVSFWESLLFSSPDSIEIAKQLEHAFTVCGYDERAIQFWHKALHEYPNTKGFRLYYAKACQRAGRLKESVKAWKMWLEDFLASEYLPSAKDETDDDFGLDYAEIERGSLIDGAVLDLTRALGWSETQQDVIAFWETNIQKFPIWDQDDPRPACLAKELLKYSRQLAPHLALMELQKAANVCPAYIELYHPLKTRFQQVNGEEQFSEFWLSLKEKYPRSPFPPIRLAQYYSSNKNYEKCVKCLIEISDEALSNGYIEDQLEVLDKGLKNPVNFWFEVVKSRPHFYFEEHFQKLCKKNDKNLAMWMELVVIYPGKLDFTRGLRKIGQNGKTWRFAEQVAFWKGIVRSIPLDWNVCECLREAFRRERTAIGQGSGEDFEEEIEFWISLLELLKENTTVRSHHIAVNQLADCFRENADSVEFRKLDTSWRSVFRRWTTLAEQYPRSKDIKSKLEEANTILTLLAQTR